MMYDKSMIIFVRLAFFFLHVFIELFWTLTSRGRNVENFLKTWMHIRSIPIVIFEFLGIAQIVFIDQLAFSIQAPPMIWQILGFLISIIGVVFASWAKFVMGTNWGRPAQHDKKQSQLVSTGPFAYSRNPIYVGLFLLFFGQQVALQSYGIVLLLVFAYAIWQAVHIEEKLLNKHFGEAYDEYKKRIPRFI